MPSAQEKPGGKSTDTAGFHEQDAQRRLGNYEGAGEHSYVQPGGNHDADR